MAVINGTSGPNRLTGTNSSDIIRGLAGNDILRGLDGPDLLDGGGGGDQMFGGLSNDTYIVNNSSDRVFETSNARPDSIDNVRSSVNFTLGANVEHLVLLGSAVSGTGNNLDNGIVGNGVNNVLKGLGGNDRLNGGIGADRMSGGTGSDTYFIDNRRDQVIEAANQGHDVVFSPLSFTALSANVEELVLDAGATRGQGNSLGNFLIGNARNNVLKGLGGGDRLEGSGGNDILDGGTGNDRLNGVTGNDVLLAGLGRDVLSGGPGADRFRFVTTADSRPGLAFEDALQDFTRSEGDKIDLVRIDANTTLAGNQAFVFIGSSATPGPGELSVFVSGGQTFVRGNTDADAALEIQFHLRGRSTVPDLASDYFL
jgi:Ca2+-binding RTX toxin-like protein